MQQDSVNLFLWTRRTRTDVVKADANLISNQRYSEKKNGLYSAATECFDKLPLLSKQLLSYFRLIFIVEIWSRVRLGTVLDRKITDIGLVTWRWHQSSLSKETAIGWRFWSTDCQLISYQKYKHTIMLCCSQSQ